jgi:hypothetical protein
MSLRLPLIDESGGPLYTVFRWTRHSRARGVRHRISLDTRFCGYDGIQLAFADRAFILKGVFHELRSRTENGNAPSP